MSPNTPAPVSRLEALKRFLFALFGVHEVLFLAGFFSFFYGIAGILSLFWAFAVCGFVLMAVAVGAILFAQRKAGA